MSPPSGSLRSPFLGTTSFPADGTQSEQETAAVAAPSPLASPFRSLYELEEQEGTFDPEAEEFAEFLGELEDEEFEEALFEVVKEASDLYSDRFEGEAGDPARQKRAAERLLEEHFAPLVHEVEALVEALATEFENRDPSALSEPEIESLIDQFAPSEELSPTFENLFGGLKKAFGKVAKKGLKLAKKGLRAAAGRVLKRLKPIIKPLFNRVIKHAINKLPRPLRPIARKLAGRLPFAREVEEEIDLRGNAAAQDVAELAHEFNEQLANAVFADNDAELEMELAGFAGETGQGSPDAEGSLDELDRAREEFVRQLGELEDGEDPSVHVEAFIPALLPALKLGLKLVGRKRVVKFLAKFVAKLIRRFVGRRYTRPLSRAIVDAGLRLVHLEATPEDEAEAPGTAVAATVEDMVRRVVELPEYVLEDEALLEGYALEAFERAAAHYLPQVLSEETYRKRPDLRREKRYRGTWVTLPMRRRKRFRKFSRIPRVKISPHKARTVKTYRRRRLSEVLQDQLGIAPGQDVEANVHLYEMMAGGLVSDVTRSERGVQGLGPAAAYAETRLHPLTREAAAVLLGEPGLGRDVPAEYLHGPRRAGVGQRLYYLEIDGTRPQMVTSATGKMQPRRSSGVSLVLDFPADRIRLYAFLSEANAQAMAVKLRQQAPVGSVMTVLGAILNPGVEAALTDRAYGGLKIIHAAVRPGRAHGSLERLPPVLLRKLSADLIAWLGRALSDHLVQHPRSLIAATEDETDGITILATLTAPPGLSGLGDALRGKPVSFAGITRAAATPPVEVRIVPGFYRD